MDVERDYYSDLGVLPDVSKEVIRAVYLALAKRFHPDSGGDHANQEKFKIINEAYEHLFDELLRQKYDEARGARDHFSYNSDVDEEEDLVVDEMVEDWLFAIEYYPELEDLRKEVSNISSTLSIVFQSIVLSEKCFASAAVVRTKIIENFVEKYFGSNKEIKTFALHLLRQKQKAAARELNKAANVFGENLDPDIVIPHITEKYVVNNPDFKFPFLLRDGKFVEQHDALAIYENDDGKFMVKNKKLMRSPGSTVYFFVQEARDYVKEFRRGERSRKERA
jgi:curved DNA-binding protein CbpA